MFQLLLHVVAVSVGVVAVAKNAKSCPQGDAIKILLQQQTSDK